MSSIEKDRLAGQQLLQQLRETDIDATGAAAFLANYAAGLVVRKLGNATATPEELAWAIENWT
jgi:bifunctional ADP-heptose synthase (sugar kinase/adenylyltransferase)